MPIEVHKLIWDSPDVPPPKDKLYYLASPYSSPDPTVMTQRYLDVEEAAAVLYHHGYSLIEPIASSHHKAARFHLPKGYEFWKERDQTMIKHCDGLIVLLLPGVEDSVGVKDELSLAKDLDMPVYFLQQAHYNYQGEL